MIIYLYDVFLCYDINLFSVSKGNETNQGSSFTSDVHFLTKFNK